LPFIVRKMGEKHCVYKEGPDGEPVGDSYGCHDSPEKARKQQAALYVHVKEEQMQLGVIRFEADEQDSDPRFLRFKKAVLARAEVNGNRDGVSEKELQELAATLPGTAIDTEHDERSNFGVFTAATVEADEAHESIPTLFVDGYFWRHRLEQARILPEDIESGRYGLSIEADAREAECSVCKKVHSNAIDYCSHLMNRAKSGAVRILRGLRAMGGALTRKPAGTDTGFSMATLFMLASHSESPEPQMTPLETVAKLLEDTNKRLDKLELEAISRREDVSPADKKRAEKEYGDVEYADEKNKKYPLDSEEHIRASWSYSHQARNMAKYSSEEMSSIHRKIASAWKSKIDKAGPPAASQKQEGNMPEEMESVHEGAPGGQDYSPDENRQRDDEEMRSTISELEQKLDAATAAISSKDAEISALQSSYDAAKSELRAHKLAELRFRLVGAVMSEAEFEESKEELLNAPPKAIELMLRPKQPAQRLQIAAAERPYPQADFSLTL